MSNPARTVRRGSRNVDVDVDVDLPNIPSRSRHRGDSSIIPSANAMKLFSYVGIGGGAAIASNQIVNDFIDTVGEIVDKADEMFSGIRESVPDWLIYLIYIIIIIVVISLVVIKTAAGADPHAAAVSDEDGIMGGGKKKKISKNVYLLIICVFIYFIYELSLKYQKLKTNKQKLEKLKQ